MLVQLLTHTPMPEQVVAAAARLCYSDSAIEKRPGQAPEQAARLLQKILRLARQAFPLPFAEAGSGCLNGPCPEGAMTCDAIMSVREEYAQL